MAAVTDAGGAIVFSPNADADVIRATKARRARLAAGLLHAERGVRRAPRRRRWAETVSSGDRRADSPACDPRGAAGCRVGAAGRRHRGGRDAGLSRGGRGRLRDRLVALRARPRSRGDRAPCRSARQSLARRGLIARVIASRRRSNPGAAGAQSTTRSLRPLGCFAALAMTGVNLRTPPPRSVARPQERIRDMAQRRDIDVAARLRDQLREVLVEARIGGGFGDGLRGAGAGQLATALRENERPGVRLDPDVPRSGARSGENRVARRSAFAPHR